MNIESTPNEQNPISEHYPLADTPQARQQQYETAVLLTQQFQNQYSPKFTDYTEDFTKVTVWDDEHDKRHYKIEDITAEEKEALDDAFEIISIYEEHYFDEYQLAEPDYDMPSEARGVERDLEDMQNIRNGNNSAPNRLHDFNTNTEQSRPEQQERDMTDDPGIDR